MKTRRRFIPPPTPLVGGPRATLPPRRSSVAQGVIPLDLLLASARSQGLNSITHLRVLVHAARADLDHTQLAARCGTSSGVVSIAVAKLSAAGLVISQNSRRPSGAGYRRIVHVTRKGYDLLSTVAP